MAVRACIMTTLVATFSLFAATDFQSEEKRLDQIESGLNAVLNKAGIHFSGTFRSQYLDSQIDSASGDETIDRAKKARESNEFTSVDFDIKARPNEYLSARLIFRMHQNWQNFFSDVANPIFSRWISIDGDVESMFRFNVGDYRQRYSPLTLWSPDIDIAYEPEIFAAKRRASMDELFLGNNDRILQGLNYNFDAEIAPLFNEVHWNVLAARLRLGATNVQNGGMVAMSFEAAPMDRYVVGTNVDLTMLRGLGLGLTYLDIFDLKSTYDKGVAEAALLAKQTAIFGGRFNPSSSLLIDSDLFTAGINAEGAFSIDNDSMSYSIDAPSGDSTLNMSKVNGFAVAVGANGQVTLGESGVLAFNVDFISNSRDYRNDMAQSPTFLGQRIMNIENDYSHNSRLYTTFDALYNNVFKFTPSANNSWTKQPTRKISYFTAILSPEEVMTKLDDEKVRLDEALQLVMPFGPATPNRTGITGKVNAQLLSKAVDVGVSFASLSEIDPDSIGGIAMGITNFMQLGGGFSVDVAHWAPPLNTLRLSFGLSLESAKNDGAVGVDSSAMDVASSFVNLGFYYNFWQRFSLLGGFQSIVSEHAIEKFSIAQNQWSAGVEYKVSDGGKITGRFGRVGGDFLLDGTALDDYSFGIWQIELYLTVNF